MKSINTSEIKELYEKTDTVWDNTPWYNYSYTFITNYLHSLKCFNSESNILNAGSAGNAYGLNYKMHHIDIASTKLTNCDDYTVGNMSKVRKLRDSTICRRLVVLKQFFRYLYQQKEIEEDFFQNHTFR